MVGQNAAGKLKSAQNRIDDSFQAREDYKK